ncbi:hypothetical protein CRP804_gp20 [Roseobacter phage CRP-804]|uniref:Uncharacterized protein n=1 Tax=Roseobacter phage CRP-804 TaxID=3072850 RepID=A0AAX3ZWE2_9CAUD|nr:hypothetical protein CRP804_gp20 [Roseobacter phage CRP-804]
MDKLPIIEKSLVEYLERMYPDVCPEISHTEREIFFRRGAVDVVRTLRRIHDEQNENILEL